MKCANCRIIFIVLTLLLVFARNGTPTAATTTYQFVGTCSGGESNCTGQATATLVLANYSPPAALSYTNFVSFTYNSNLQGTLSFTGSSDLTGQFTNLPGFDQTQIYPTSGNPEGWVFDTGTDGTWSLGIGDSGTAGTWSLATTPTTPAPSTLLLLILGLAALAAFQGRARIAGLFRSAR